MIANKIILGLCLTGLIALSSASVHNRIRGMFSRFFGKPIEASPLPSCSWISDYSTLPELSWNQRDLCFNTGAEYVYPRADVETALANDLPMLQMWDYLTQCYEYQNQTHYHGWDQTLYTQDLCPVRRRQVEMVWMDNIHSAINPRGHCFIVRPEIQNIQMAQCGDGTNSPNSQKCKLDECSYFSGNYYCIPDGYTTRTAIVYCPFEVENKCKEVTIRIPTACSCKQYQCDKLRASGVGSLAGFSNIASRFNGK